MPVIGLEPSCILGFRDELPALLKSDDARALASNALLFEEFLAREAAAGTLDLPLKPVARRALLHGHCHQKSFGAMIRCTNKVFLMELLGQHQVATPPTIMLSDASDQQKATDLQKAIDELALPLVVKIPDGSFSRGVHKIESLAGFKRVCDELFEETDLLLAQKFLPTEFDWRVGVLAGEPLFVCQYRMARGHWQIVKHRPDGSAREGGFRTFDLDKAPPQLIDIAVRAARPIGDGFYGVDIKETDYGFIVMEVNDNPNLEHGIEDQVGKDEIWVRLLKWFVERFEQ